jgi:hypothetical protein
VNLIFEFGIGIDACLVEFEDHSTGAEPFLKEHTLKKHKRWICISAFTAGTDSIMSHQNLFNALPVNGSIELLHLPR